MNSSIFPCLWFKGEALEAANFYCSIFPNSKILANNPMVVTFQINGYKIMALNGTVNFTFNESTSLVIECETQSEIDAYWDGLLKGGGQEGHCGWLKDKYGFSWQIVPKILATLMNDPNKAQKTFEVFRHTKKFQISDLED